MFAHAVPFQLPHLSKQALLRGLHSGRIIHRLVFGVHHGEVQCFISTYKVVDVRQRKHRYHGIDHTVGVIRMGDQFVADGVARDFKPHVSWGPAKTMPSIKGARRNNHDLFRQSHDNLHGWVDTYHLRDLRGYTTSTCTFSEREALKLAREFTTIRRQVILASRAESAALDDLLSGYDEYENDILDYDRDFDDDGQPLEALRDF